MTETNPLDEFEDIRPYNDDEVPEVMARLMDSRELADTLLCMKYPILFRYFHWILRPFLRRGLHKRFDSIRTVHDLQMLVGRGMEAMLERSGTSFEVSGLEHLDQNKSYLFISNHRDIAMDPAFVNYALHSNGMDTVRIAIGDNLLSKPFVSDLIRINKSFIVRRSVKGKREKLLALTILSRYIRHSLFVDKTHVWIAQREGRAKDGIDRTETALLKMLGLSKEKGQSFAEAVADMHIVPVSISYMFDPCDLDKAREIHQRKTTGEYHKTQFEDLQSLHNGIIGYKGAVHLSFGTEIEHFESADELAAELDRQIIGNYRLQPTNLIAWQRLNGPDTRVAHLKANFPDCDWPGLEEELMARVAQETEGVRQAFLAAYANPVQSLLDLIDSQDADIA
jgi:1-acyl-sn-glycerol-3-phosphate acyltransferase